MADYPSPVTTLLLARHGETDWNREGRWQGQVDTTLNEAGRAQARALARALAGERLVAVYASDLARARETAEVVAREHGLSVTVDPRLREIDFGAFEGLTTAEIEARADGGAPPWPTDDDTAFPGGETYAAMGTRVVTALSDVAASHPDGAVLIVLHGGPIRGALAHAAGITYTEQRHRRAHLANGEIVRLRVEGTKFTPAS
jgi:broad specificity phosphatase PhoE